MNLESGGSKMSCCRIEVFRLYARIIITAICSRVIVAWGRKEPLSIPSISPADKALATSYRYQASPGTSGNGTAAVC
ncbi:hypothetical protein D3C73_1591910 [compost metagenome]